MGWLLPINTSSVLSSSAGGGTDGNVKVNSDDKKKTVHMDIKNSHAQDLIKGTPVNVSAVHFCAPSQPMYKIAVAILLTMCGKEMRSRSRSHFGSSIIEKMYTLQSFGIQDFPLTHTGTIKTKAMKNFITARTAIDAFRQEQCKRQMQVTGTAAAFSTDDPPGIECPEMNCVVFGHTQKSKNHKGNLDFRDMVRIFVLREENKSEEAAAAAAATLNKQQQVTSLIDEVIEEISKEFVFRTYDTKNCWYRQITDPIELRSHVANAIRYVRKRIVKQKNQEQAEKVNKKEQQHQRVGANKTKLENAICHSDDDNQDSVLKIGLDPRRLKRFKKDHSKNNNFVRNCIASDWF